MVDVVDVPVVVDPLLFVVDDVPVVVALFDVVGTVAVAEPEPAPEPLESPLPRSGVVAGSGFSASSSVLSAG
jgi:hypothetical protein